MSVNSSEGAQKLIQKIVNYGFDVGNHTFHHKDLANLSDSEVYDESVGVQATLDKFEPGNYRYYCLLFD